MIITGRSLKAAGYQSYTDPLKEQDSTYLIYRGSWMKWFYGPEGRGKRFAVHINLYTINDPNRGPIARADGYTQFQDSAGHTFNVDLFIYDDTTIELVEAFYERAWTVLNCQWYEEAQW